MTGYGEELPVPADRRNVLLPLLSNRQSHSRNSATPNLSFGELTQRSNPISSQNALPSLHRCVLRNNEQRSSSANSTPRSDYQDHDDFGFGSLSIDESTVLDMTSHPPSECRVERSRPVTTDEGTGTFHDYTNYRRRYEDYRSDARGQVLLGKMTRIFKRSLPCPREIHLLDGPLLAIYESLVPRKEEKEKQKQLLASLERIVKGEWPQSKLRVYGSCANSFGFSKSDIDISLEMKDPFVNKTEVLLKLEDMLISHNLQNVKALTRARVPLVKLLDPVTGISCDICINNSMAIINTKLLRDYAQVDNRLQQLVFIVKHWAKSRKVNETYQGTLSSYAYVLMCIHFLQTRQPSILPCLQRMNTTYQISVDYNVCAYFDQVERLSGFGSANKESIGQLVWGFFRYWAYCHSYKNDVISVRTGGIISKREKDWTRRIGNDRHLICIEDPFELHHDLGRVVDFRSLDVLREEFERAAEIMQSEPNPCAKLFQPYIPPI